jgi:hypothetical protein
VEEAVQAVRDAKDAAAESLTPAEYKEFLEELVADAEGYSMELQEME